MYCKNLNTAISVQQNIWWLQISMQNVTGMQESKISMLAFKSLTFVPYGTEKLAHNVLLMDVFQNGHLFDDLKWQFSI